MEERTEANGVKARIENYVCISYYVGVKSNSGDTVVVNRREGREQHRAQRGRLRTTERSTIVPGIGGKGYSVREECFFHKERSETR